MKAESERIIKFIKDYVEQSGRKGVVLGLSGGIDSAVVAVLAKKACKELHCYYLPMIDMKRGDFDKDHIEKLCKRFDLTYQTEEIGMDVEGIVDNILGGVSKVVYGNIKARIRMTILYQYANRLNCLVAGTTNKSEWMIGYFTKYGDGGADLEPLQHIYKTQVYELAKYLDIPNEIIDKPPTAGLWDGQTDEGELKITYKQLDKCLKYYCAVSDSPQVLTEMFYDTEEGKKIKEMEPPEMDYVLGMIKESDHKRRMPKCLE